MNPFPATSQGLLATLLADPDLLQQATASKATSLTVTLEIDPQGRSRIDHPEWRDGRNPLSMTGGSQGAPLDEGFVPFRQMVGPGKRPDSQTEYRLVGELGSGGTGVVYQAHQRAINREVAVKVLRDELAKDTVARSRFLLEARTIGSLDHPNVIALHELGTGPEGELFYSMKRIDGTSWDRSLDTMSFEENLSTLLRLCDAIRYAHSRELIHRDIKPENVMLGRFGEVLLADWGLALSLDPADLAKHQPMAIGGTPAYMAPELAMGDTRSQSIRTDIYLLGGLLYRILTGQTPHHGDNLLECIRRAAKNEIRETGLRSGWLDVALRAMATRPEDRFPDVATFVEAIYREKEHERSTDLLRRAERLIRKVGPAAKHNDYGVAAALIRESLDAWPGNREAAESLADLQTAHARAAAASGDFDLALDLLAQAGQADSEMAARIRAQRETRAEQAVRESRFSQLFTQAPDAGLMIRWADGEIVEANRRFERLTGFESAAVVGRKLLDLHFWATPELRDRFVEVMAAPEGANDFETRILRHDGSPLEIAVCSAKVQVDGEDFFLFTLRDIGLRVRAQRELAQSRQQLKEMQRLAQLGAWQLNIASGEVRWSEESFQIMSTPQEHGTPGLDEYLELIHPEDRQRLREAIDNTTRYKTVYELKLRHRRPEGGWNTAVARGQPVQNEQGDVVEIHGVMIDITRYVQ
ncbi:MAG: PAS domain S-box protein [Planctomycetaceae bacterium]|nr:MAG: PAS domain S-box protein [Planctomycetaceae bacterium]